MAHRLCVIDDKSIPRQLNKWNATQIAIKDGDGNKLLIPDTGVDNFIKFHQSEIEDSQIYQTYRQISPN